MASESGDNTHMTDDEGRPDPARADAFGDDASTPYQPPQPPAPPQPYLPPQPQYGQPQYEQPQYGQPQYGQPQYPPPPAQPYAAGGYPPPPAQPYAAGGYPPPQAGYELAAPYGVPYSAASSDVVAGGSHRSGRRWAPVVTSVVAVVAVVVAGGAFAAYHLLASKGSQPDVWAPSNSVFYAKIDLDPAAATKLAVWQFEQKFPHAPKAANADSLKDSLLQAIFDDQTGTSTVDYTTDIKPWIGSRAAVAAFPDSAGQAQEVAIVETTDPGTAASDLAKIAQQSDGTLGYAIHGSYVVLGDSQPAVDAAVAAAQQGNIGDSATFNADTAQLKGNRIITAWWDIGATLKLAEAQDQGNLGGSLFGGGLGLVDASKAGRMVMGLSIEASSAELDGRVIGNTTSSDLNGHAGADLGNLPGGTVAGLALSNPEKIVKNELTSLQSGLLGEGLQSELDAAGAQLHLSLPGDIENLLGSEVVVGLDAAPDAAGLGKALYTVITKPDDPAKGLETAKILASQAAATGGSPLTASLDGSTVVVTDDSAPKAGKLADDPLFKTALSGMPTQSILAGYVDLHSLLASDAAQEPDLGHLGGLGFYVGADATTPVFAIKLTVS
jgi:hypothetical protein